jgi:hypothetical protein
MAAGESPNGNSPVLLIGGGLLVLLMLAVAVGIS